MKINKQTEEQLKEILEAAEHLEILLENLWKETNGDAISIRCDPLLIVETKEMEDIELSLSDLADGKLRDAYLKA